MFGLPLLLNKILFHYQRFSFYQYLCYLLSSSFNMILRKISLMSVIKAYWSLLNLNRIANYYLIYLDLSKLLH